MKFWLIRHKPTGFYLPQPDGRMERGGSHVEPADKNEQEPRLFKSRRAATNALGQWLRGKFTRGSGYDSLNHEYYEDISVTPVPSRVKADMEIVELEMEIP